MRPFFILSILAFYVLFQFCWWAYLLVDLNNEVYEHKIENVQLKARTPEESREAIADLEKKNTQRRWMVIGEGSVFLALLTWGSILTARSIRKEMALARQQKNFLLSITHEFKSPLASIKLYLQTILRHDLEKEKEKSFINSAINDTERLNNLVENALLANLIDHNGYSFAMEDMNLSALMRLHVQKLQNVPDPPKFETHIEEGLHIQGDKNALILMISNLIENAWKYSPKEIPLGIDLKRDGKKIVLCILDKGPGIPDSEKDKIFKKFYRLGNEETRKTKGTGLGLFIVKYIAQGHNGQISVYDNKPNGTIFCIQFPAYS
ncbi:MAG: HAMP domain-containing histidine kinase [Bacteroidetes bacterium]|nr:HAMP domain-containing histidine kinase [Bacteroidota bacterium]MBL0066678.1 HAMP domain-containing histidine kinase [Bacteroidota bacterium]MBL0138670.1 HAMP domain-containing histidine kinase [Bacteroidota bacterium]